MTKTDLIFDLTCPYDNPYQGNTTRILFVCSVGMLRSPTAANVAIKMGYNARACGSDIDMALIPISVNLIVWAKRIVFVEAYNRIEARKHFFGDSECTDKIDRAEVWDLPDDYDYMHPQLVSLIEQKLYAA